MLSTIIFKFLAFFHWAWFTVCEICVVAFEHYVYATAVLIFSDSASFFSLQLLLTLRQT